MTGVGFVRRFRDVVPPLSVIQAIEGVLIVDQAGPSTPTGAGTGAVLLVGEFEDGPLSIDSSGVTEVFGEQDFAAVFGGLGFIYDNVPSQNPCARKHDGEFWNGNGFLKAFGLKSQRLMIARVDSSVGSVSFSPLAIIQGTKNVPVALAVGQQLAITSDTGGPASSTAIAATAAVVTGIAATYPTGFVGGESISIELNVGTYVVVFSATDQALVDVEARINEAVGFTLATTSAGQVRLTNTLMLGTRSKITLADVTTGALAVLGLTAATTNGTGNVPNVSAVTSADVATILNATAALTGIDVSASVTSDGFLRIQSDTPGAGTILIAASAMATALGLLTATTVEADGHAGGLIPAGTRVRKDSTHEWVTMQTLDIPAASAGPWAVKVRPALDDGTAVAASIGDVGTVVDQPTFAQLVVNNPSALTAAKTEPQMDVAYNDAFLQTIKSNQPAEQANYLLCARRTDTLIIYAVQNTKDAEAKGLFGRKYITGPRLGTSPSAAIIEVGTQSRYDRKWYCPLGLKVNVPQIAAVGTDGGEGFTDDGVITVRPDGPLTTICATLAPEENPGQQTNLIDQFFAVDTFGHDIDIETYEAFKRAGLCAPRVSSDAGTFFQSAVTTDLNESRSTIARRKMADFIQDSIPAIAMPYCKKLSKQTNRDLLLADWDSYLAGLLSANASDLQRINDYSTDDSQNAGNTPTTLGKGIYFVKTKVRTLSSMDDIVFVTEIGPQVIVSTEQR